MRTLYKFILNPETGEISVQEITKYDEGRWAYSRGYIKYRDRGQIIYCYKKDLDRFKCGHLYSFNDSFDHAYKIIVSTLREKADKAKKEFDKYDALFNMAISANSKEV